MSRLTRKRRCGACSATGGLRRSSFVVRNYILDFACFDKRLIIEIDGSQHADSERDMIREAALLAEGFRIARYWNNDVLQRPLSVLEDVLSKLAER
jgi:very-short-patch-repair endonuclease